MSEYTTLGGRCACTRCNAISKRSRNICRNPAIKGKTKCRHHGGKSTGNKTKLGRARQIAELYELEMLGRELGMISGNMVERKPRVKVSFLTIDFRHFYVLPR